MGQNLRNSTFEGEEVWGRGRLEGVGVIRGRLKIDDENPQFSADVVCVDEFDPLFPHFILNEMRLPSSTIFPKSAFKRRWPCRVENPKVKSHDT